jgi:hypothetical protein
MQTLTATDPIKTHDYQPGRMNLAGQQKPAKLAGMAAEVEQRWSEYSDLVDVLTSGAQVNELRRACIAFEQHYRAELARFHFDPDAYWEEVSKEEKQDLFDQATSREWLETVDEERI